MDLPTGEALGIGAGRAGRAFAVAVFTRPHRPFERLDQIDEQMAAGVAAAIAALRPTSS